MKENGKSKINVLFKIIFCFALLLIAFLITNISNKCFAANKQTDIGFCYLSDIPYDASKSKSGWK